MTTKPLAEAATDWTIHEINHSIYLLVKQFAQGQSVLDLGDDVTYDLDDLRARLGGIRAGLATLLDELHARALIEYQADPMGVDESGAQERDTLRLSARHMSDKFMGEQLAAGPPSRWHRAVYRDELHDRALDEFQAYAARVREVIAGLPIDDLNMAAFGVTGYRRAAVLDELHGRALEEYRSVHHCPGCWTVVDTKWGFECEGHKPTCPCAYSDHRVPAEVAGSQSESTEIQ
jgi:hypothetical protein